MMVRKEVPRRLPYEIIEPLYEGGYSTQDIANIVGTSQGSISRGLKNRIMKGKTVMVRHIRPKGKRTNRLSPSEIEQIAPAFIENMDHLGYLDRFEDYYQEVSRLQKASFIKSTKAANPRYIDSEVAEALDMTETELLELESRVDNVWLQGQVNILAKIEEDKGLAERYRIEAKLLRRLYQLFQEEFAQEAIFERQYEPTDNNTPNGHSA